MVKPQKSWTSGELKLLRETAPDGASAVAALLGRSERSIRQMAHRQRVSLRRQGERRGLILGQSRWESWAQTTAIGVAVSVRHKLREAVLAGEVDMGELERQARRLTLLAQGAPLCPSCARNPQERSATGLCNECHLRALAAAHRQEESDHAAQRELWAARQQKVRQRRRSHESSDL